MLQLSWWLRLYWIHLQCGRPWSIPGLGRSSGGDLATHSSILAWRIPMDRGAWGVTFHGVAKSWTWLSEHSTLLSIHNEMCIHFYTFVHLSIWTRFKTNSKTSKSLAESFIYSNSLSILWCYYSLQILPPV